MAQITKKFFYTFWRTHGDRNTLPAGWIRKIDYISLENFLTDTDILFRDSTEKLL